MRHQVLVLALAFALSRTQTAHADVSVSCDPPPPPSKRRIAAALVKAAKPNHSRGRIAAFPPSCMPHRSNEMLYETGYGHGGVLHLTHVTSDPASDGGELVRITINEHVPEGQPATILVERAHYNGKLAALLDEARLAAHFTMEERQPPAKNGTLSLGAWISSSDFYVRLDELSFAGYASGDDQYVYLPIRHAIEGLDTAFEKLAWKPVPIDANVRDLFVRAFLRARPTLDREFHWWVRELYVRAAGQIGTAHLAPALEKWRDAVVKETDYSGVRTKAYAKRALEELGAR